MYIYFNEHLSHFFYTKYQPEGYLLRINYKKLLKDNTRKTKKNLSLENGYVSTFHIKAITVSLMNIDSSPSCHVITLL